MEDLRTTFLSLFAPEGVDTKPTRFFIPGVRPGVIQPVVTDVAVIGVYDFRSIASIDDTFPFTRCWSRCAAGDIAGFLGMISLSHTYPPTTGVVIRDV